jgi:sortase A
VTTTEPEAPPERSAPAKRSKFDRPRPPRDWRWWVGGLGKVLIATGILLFGFVAYQLWGTGIEKARAQAALENEFEELLSEATPVTTAAPPDAGPEPTTPVESVPSDSVPVDSAPVGSVPVESVPADNLVLPAPELPPIEDGDPVARIEIPRIGVDDIVVAGVDKGDLKKGPGHYPGTPLPGQLGNAAIAGHRTTYGQPFYDVDDLQPGDEIVVTTLAGRYVYRVTGQEIVSPQDYEVIATVDPERANLTLTSCHPKWTTRERIIVYSELDPDASASPVTEAVINYGRDDASEADDVDPTNTVVADDDAPDDNDAPDDGATDDDATDDGATDDGATDDDAADAGGTDDDATAAPGDETPAAEPVPAGVDAEIADAFSDGWFSDPGAPAQVALWGLVLSAIAVASYLLSRRFKRDWVGFAVGIVPFLVTLYFFFQNVNRLLPPAL